MLALTSRCWFLSPILISIALEMRDKSMENWMNELERFELNNIKKNNRASDICCAVYGLSMWRFFTEEEMRLFWLWNIEECFMIIDVETCLCVVCVRLCILTSIAKQQEDAIRIYNHSHAISASGYVSLDRMPRTLHQCMSLRRKKNATPTRYSHPIFISVYMPLPCDQIEISLSE